VGFARQGRCFAVSVKAFPALLPSGPGARRSQAMLAAFGDNSMTAPRTVSPQS
jgi:hypothetical protein